MTKIAEVLARDFSTPIEEIVKVNNADDDTVYTELTEYVATDRIKVEYERLFRAMADAPKAPNQGIGVWISGFFGSGKSSFAKNLGYVLADREVKKQSASALFNGQVESRRIAEYVDLLNTSVPYEVFMFDVQVDLSVQTNSEQIAEVMYRVLLRQLDYAEDYDIAELEIELESEKRLDRLQELCRKEYKEEWRKIRKGNQKFARASLLLHQLDPKTYPTVAYWIDKVKDRPSSALTVKRIIERCFDLCALRRPGKAFAFIVDEMGQYVARSGERLENLRAIVEQFGNESLQRLKAKTIPGPAWIIVTAQEKLQDVYNYLATGRIDLPRVQDRFKHQIDLSPEDIRQVATRRVLKKKEDRESQEKLRTLFKQSGPLLIQNIKLDRSSRTTAFSEEEFVQFYPYLPHFIDLSIDIMTGIRLQPNAPKHLGGSNRTIIKQSFEMLVSDRTQLAEQPLGTLVSIDKIYELVEGNIPSEKQKDVLDIRERFDADHQGMASRVAKAITLMEFAKKDIPRSAHNIASLLIRNVSENRPLPAVTAVLERLKEAQFVRETEDGWKLQTAQEKSWDQEKRSIPAPNRNERAEILRPTVKDVLETAKANKVTFKSLRTFDTAFSLDGQALGQTPKGARVSAQLHAVHESEDFAKRCSAISTQSLEGSNKDSVHWVFPVSREAEALLEDLHASKRMIAKYDHLSSQQQLRDGEKALLQAEQANRDTLEVRLHTKLEDDLRSGVGFFQSLRFEGGDLGKDLGAMIRGLAEQAIPVLYPKLEMGSRPVEGNEAETFLKQANLSTLPPIFQPGEKGLGLVIKAEGGKYVPNTKADIAQEILTYLKGEHSYGNKVTGGQLAEHFGGIGYGWSSDIVRLVLAVLFRAGAIEITHQGRRYRNYQEPQARNPFESNPAFRSAGFAPRESIDLKTLTKAVQELENMLGREVDIEESAIADEFQRLARTEKEQVLPALAQARALELPLIAPLAEWAESLEAVSSSQSDDCVRMLAGEGRSLRTVRERAQRIRMFLENARNIEIVRCARSVLRDEVPLLAKSTREPVAEEASISEAVASPDLPERIREIESATAQIDAAYRRRFTEQHRRRAEAYRNAIESIRKLPDYAAVDPEKAEVVLAPILRRAAEDFELPAWTAGDRLTGATLATLDEDLELLPSLEAGALRQLARLRESEQEPKETVEIVRLSDFLPKTLPLNDYTDEEIDRAIDNLRQKLHNLRELKRRVVWD